ncbi:hypothetical protein KAI92_01315 [Candidatus Parcubacteria bacterium]|nr:hypothetical protein [Candidatus Parcubacteria bacterium]
MTKNKKNTCDQQEKTIDEEKRELVISRLSVLSSDTIVSFGSAGSFSRDELIECVEKKNEVGKKIVEIQMEWLKSFKEGIVV